MSTTRRKFAKTIAAAAFAVPAIESLAQTAPPPPAAAPPPPPAPSPLAEALTQIVDAEFGKFLTPEEMATIRKDFADAVPVYERLRKFPLTNADEPDSIFVSVDEGKL